METKLSSSCEPSDGAKKPPPSRLQKRAPASLRLEPSPGVPAPAAAWKDGGLGDGAPIPLLSPLIVAPVPAWEAEPGARRDEGSSSGDGAGGGRHRAHGNGERQPDEAQKPPPVSGGGWRHPALPTPVAEPASLVPFFQSQCALQMRNARQ